MKHEILLRRVLEHEIATAKLVKDVRDALPEGECQRQAAISRTEFEIAFMRLARAVSDPPSPWKDR